MAGGSKWVAVDEAEEGPVYQKVAGGPWYTRERVSVEIEQTVGAAEVSIRRGVLNSRSGILTYRRGRSLVTISLASPNKFVCTLNRIINDVPQSTMVKQRQRWTFESSTETEL